MSGILSVVATPIGNLDDLSPRAARALASADVIACEDTRVTRVLLNARVPDARARLVSFHSRNEAVKTPELVRAIASGSRIALATDAGTPGVSDPGHKLIAACAGAGLRIEAIPGPSAVINALITSGLPSARFVFEGFLPRTGSARRRRLEALAREERTVVLFESPHRVAASLADIAAAFGADRRAAVARELTKLHEETARGTLAELVARAESEPFRGEITIVIEGAPEVDVSAPDAGALAAAVADMVAAGWTKKDAIAAVAVEKKVRKREVYDAVIAGDAG